MREPFVGRQARTFEYTMSDEERALYDDITLYLLEPSLYAFRGNHRKLLLLGFHRRMASSLPALAASLDKVADRLRALRDRHETNDARDATAVRDDLEDDDLEAEAGEAAEDAPAGADRDGIVTELARVERFIERARALPQDSKARALIQAVKLAAEQAEHGKGSGKVVIFTESLTTQDYVRKLLIDDGLVGDGDVTIFRGNNDSPRAGVAHDRWMEDVGRHLPAESRPSDDVAVRLALVHEFRTRSRVFISTEAGAKGLNLQFCDTIINYDLPWNPQRIEQRIGRCHRYGQRRDVTVINFLAADNEAQRLTFDILSQKLDLFGTVLGATDEVLHRPGAVASETLASALGGEFEGQLRRIYERSRTLEEVERELRDLREAMAVRKREFEAALERTEGVIQRRFDVTVKASFRRIQQELPAELAALDRDLEAVVLAYLERAGIPHRVERHAGGATVRVLDDARLPTTLRGLEAFVLGTPPAASPFAALHLGHPLVLAALQQARADSRASGALRIEVTAVDAALRGRRGRLRLVRVVHKHFEVTEHLLPLVLLEDDDAPLEPGLARRLLDAPMTDRADPPGTSVTSDAVDDALDELLFHDTNAASRLDQPRFERALEQVERFVADRVLLLERRRDAVVVRLAKAEDARDRALGADQRAAAERAMRKAQAELDDLDARLGTLRAGDDERYRKWRAHTEARRYTPPELEILFDAEIELQ